METTKKIKLYVLTGFLGSGKTSMLLKILDNLSGHKVGVLQNEFGRIDVDSEILKRDGLVMTELTRGSIFCTCLQLKFAQALAEMSKQDIEYLFVESSGLADPSNIDEILEGVKVMAGDVYEMSGVICLVDAVNFLEQVADEITVDRQLKHCHRAVVNKVDLVEEEQLSKVIETVRKYNPICDIDTTTFGDIGTTFLTQDLMAKQWAQSEATTNSVDTKPKTMSLNFDGVAPKEKLEVFLQQIIPHAYRIKGFFQLDDGWQQVDVVGKKIDYKPCEAKAESHLVFISKIGPQIIRPIDTAWKEIVGLPMKLKN
ncbi:MAG: GTP-binding protein [Oscillospiraceae bacterium]|nr:GTP-binding protein [Oscillospiraceae bacterium]